MSPPPIPNARVIAEVPLAPITRLTKLLSIEGFPTTSRSIAAMSLLSNVF